MLSLVRGDPVPRERGTVLLLFPAAVLIMFILGATVVDVGFTQVRARELEGVAASAANDALGALDIDALRAGEGVRISESDARAIVGRSVGAGPLPDAEVELVEVTIDGAGRTVISVSLRLTIGLVMAPAVGELDQITLRRTEHAVIVGSDL